MKNLSLVIALTFSVALAAPSFAAITSNDLSIEVSDKDKDKEKKKKKSCCSGEGKDKKCSSSK